MTVSTLTFCTDNIVQGYHAAFTFLIKSFIISCFRVFLCQSAHKVVIKILVESHTGPIISANLVRWIL